MRTKPIPKELIPAAMEIIKSVRVDAPVKIGENIISNLLGTGIDVIATKTLLLIPLVVFRLNLIFWFEECVYEETSM